MDRCSCWEDTASNL